MKLSIPLATDGQRTSFRRYHTFRRRNAGVPPCCIDTKLASAIGVETEVVSWSRITHERDKLMNEIKRETVTCKCPRGHKLRGNAGLIGKTVCCPRCSEKFIFGYQVRQYVSDTAVVRILGDAPTAPPLPRDEPETRPCTRCGVAISAVATVCEHCNCYVGHLPDYMGKMGDRRPASQN